MCCNNTCRLCDRLIISESVSFADSTLAVNIPAGSYANGEKYCIVVAQSIPEDTTIDAPVVITIGTGADSYPLVGKNCTQLTARGLRTRVKYPTVVNTTATGGNFRLLSALCVSYVSAPSAIDGGGTAAE